MQEAKGAILGKSINVCDCDSRMKILSCRCSDGFNFNLYKEHLLEPINSQSREQFNSLVNKCSQCLRLMNYRHFMIFMRVFFATTNIRNRKFK